MQKDEVEEETQEEEEKQAQQQQRGHKSRLSSGASPKEPSFDDEELFCSEDKSSSNGDNGTALEANNKTAVATSCDDAPPSPVRKTMDSVDVVKATTAESTATNPLLVSAAPTTLPTTSL